MLSKKGFKVRLYDSSDAFIVAFVLSLLDINKAIKKWGYK